MGEWRKRSLLLSRTTVIWVVNGRGSIIPATVKYSSGPSTMPIPAATDLYTLSGSYTRDAASNTELPRSPASDFLCIGMSRLCNCGPISACSAQQSQHLGVALDYSCP